jgi:hypothetical protein
MSRPYNPPDNKTVRGLLEPGNIVNLYNRPVTKAPAGPNGLQKGVAYTEDVPAVPGVMNKIPGQEYGDYPGSTSTTFSKSFTINGKETLIPTVVDGKFLTDQEAIDRFNKTGEHLGIFADPKSADEYATALHKSQEAIGNYYGATSKLMPETKQPTKKRTPRK